MGFYKSLANKKYGHLLVLSDYTNEEEKQHRHWCHCLCDCGLNIDIRADRLTSEKIKSCGRCDSVYAVGKKFGKLTVVTTFYKDHHLMCNCICDCHKNREYTVVQYSKLLHGYTKSCGCYRSEWTINRNKTHGMSKTRLYNIWSLMKGRCYNSKFKFYKNYGGRGIS